MLASGDAKRWQTASIVTLASRAPSVNLLPILKRLLDDNLRRYRAFRKEAQAARWRPSEAVNEARRSYTWEYQRTLVAIHPPETAAMMLEYLADEHFGSVAAQVLADQWIAANEPPKGNRLLGGVDLSRVQERRAARAANPEATSVEAEAIFAAIELLVMDGVADEQKRLAVTLGTVASRLPHGQRDGTIQKLIALAERRARSSLLLNLILSGEEVDIKVVADGNLGDLRGGKNQDMDIDAERWIRTEELVAPPAVREPAHRRATDLTPLATCATRAALFGGGGRGVRLCSFGRS